MSQRIPGLAYGGDSLATPRSYRPPRGWLRPTLSPVGYIVLELVHPGNLGPLPPSPMQIALAGARAELGTVNEFLSH